MFNQNNYNAAVYNAPGNLAGLADQDSVVFDGYSLQNSEIIVTRLSHEVMPTRDFRTSPIPRNDGEFIINDFWRRKFIKIKGIIKTDSASLLEAKIDEFKKRLAPREKNLDIKVNGVVRRYVATLTNGNQLFDRDSYHISYIPFDAEFTVLNPFGEDVDYTSTSTEDAIDLSPTHEFDNGGTIKARPIITFNFSAAVNLTKISITNNTRNETIELNANISAPAYVRFDSEQRTVSIDGVEQDYDGSFPELNTGTNTFTITITADSATYTITEKHKTPYL